MTEHVCTHVDNEGDFTHVGARRYVGKSLCFVFSFVVKLKLLLNNCILKNRFLQNTYTIYKHIEKDLERYTIRLNNVV